ncbi:MAG: hypothetical protein CMJ36_03340 [Phycisphaerae bacterium]|nr:hypothetical protein [Phycisphaerae bacterium]
MAEIILHPEVESALLAATPIVLLESAVLTAGMPDAPWRENWEIDALEVAVPGWNRTESLALELGRRMESTVREHGAVPCTTAVIDGNLHLGLDEGSLETLIKRGHGAKASMTSMSHCMQAGGCAGTTVSGALLACRILNNSLDRDSNWVPTLATGGIGGVHRHWQDCPDVSVDLHAMATTRACIVASGSKSILDTSATLEVLESSGVPVLGWKTGRWPAFITKTPVDAPCITRVEDAAEVKRTCSTQWDVLDLDASILLANPLDDSLALESALHDEHAAAGEDAATERGASGIDRTPFLLGYMADATKGRSVAANLALLLDNATRAAEISCLLAGPHLA